MLQIRNLLRYLVAIGLNIFIMMALHSYINFVLLIGLLVFRKHYILTDEKTEEISRTLEERKRA